jgi:AmpD protein
MNEFTDGWWRYATHRPSPHHDARPAGVVPDLLVIHAISLPPDEFGGDCIDALFRGTLDPASHPALRDLDGLRVSAHFLIARDGALMQYVATGARAWHAGISMFAGRTACNDHAIGIELEGSDQCPFTPPQYATLVSLCAALCREYPALGVARVVGHADIAPGRKTDPGPYFEWRSFLAALRRELVVCA